MWAPNAELTYSTFVSAIGFPMAVLLPLVAILSVTSEWSQRSGLTTFTLIPHRHRIITAKSISSVIVGVVSVLLAFAIGALGNLLNAALTSAPLVWDVSQTDFWYFLSGSVLGLLIGFMLGILIRASSGAIAAYFVLLVPAAHDLPGPGHQPGLVQGPAAVGGRHLRPRLPVHLRRSPHR